MKDETDSLKNLLLAEINATTGWLTKRLAKSLLVKQEKFCSIETCNSPEPHFHCSECQSKNGVKYDIIQGRFERIN